MIPVRFVIEGDKIIEVEVGDYRFKCKNTPISVRSTIESLFRQLNSIGIQFTAEEKISFPRKLKRSELIFLELKDRLTRPQKAVLELYKEKEKVSWIEIRRALESSISPKERDGKNIRQIWAGVSSGVTRKARSLEILDKNESAFIWNEDDETYELNPKLKPILELLKG